MIWNFEKINEQLKEMSAVSLCDIYTELYTDDAEYTIDKICKFIESDEKMCAAFKEWMTAKILDDIHPDELYDSGYLTEDAIMPAESEICYVVINDGVKTYPGTVLIGVMTPEIEVTGITINAQFENEADYIAAFEDSSMDRIGMIIVSELRRDVDIKTL